MNPLELKLEIVEVAKRLDALKRASQSIGLPAIKLTENIAKARHDLIMALGEAANLEVAEPRHK